MEHSNKEFDCIPEEQPRSNQGAKELLNKKTVEIEVKTQKSLIEKAKKRVSSKRKKNHISIVISILFL